MTIDVSEVELMSRLRNFEDHFVERKTAADSKDWLKTVVAFANSAPVGLPAILYIGVKNDGQIETPQQDLDSLQKTLNKELRKVYPRVPCIQKIVGDSGRQALAVIISGSPNRPHFAGPSYIRSGSETIEASDEQFSELIASRNSKVAKIVAYKGKLISAVNRQRTANHTSESNWGGSVTVNDCDQFYVTLATGPEPKDRTSFPLNEIEISFDNAFDRLLLKIHR